MYELVESVFGSDALILDSLVKIVLIKRKDALYELHEVHDIATDTQVHELR